jgi:hypothetical protein
VGTAGGWAHTGPKPGQRIVQAGEQLRRALQSGLTDLGGQGVLLPEGTTCGLKVIELAAGDVVLAAVVLHLPDDPRVVVVEVGGGDRSRDLLLVGAVDQLDVEVPRSVAVHKLDR